MRRLSVQLSRIEETAAAMRQLYQQRKIRAIGVSNYSLEQMNVFQHVAPLHTAQLPYNAIRAGYREGRAALLSGAWDQHSDLRRAVPRTAEQKNETGHRISRRRCP